MDRRRFLRAMLAGAVAPAIVKAENIMRVRPLPSGILVPDPELDRITDQIEARVAAVRECIFNINPHDTPLGTWKAVRGSVQIYEDTFLRGLT